jgi:hypothetical protein
VPQALEEWLTDFVAFAVMRKTGRWTKWARKWPRLFADSVVASEIVSNLEANSMTWEEATDEAADWFNGTPAAGSPDALKKAYQRDKRRGPRRPLTAWQVLQGHGVGLFAREARLNDW